MSAKEPKASASIPWLMPDAKRCRLAMQTAFAWPNMHAAKTHKMQILRSKCPSSRPSAAPMGRYAPRDAQGPGLAGRAAGGRGGLPAVL